jgi:hypothetical protein
MAQTFAFLPPPVQAPPALAVVKEDAEPDPEAQIQMGGLSLTQAQIDRLVEKFIRRMEEVRDEMGILVGGQCQTNGWAWEREKNQAQYDNDWEWRKALGGIFRYSNFSLNISKRYARLMAAKTSDTLVGTDPFFSAMPTEHGNPELAKQAEWFIQEKISQSNAKRRIKEAQKTALIRNESVVKLSYVNNDTHFRGPAIVAVGPFAYQAQPTKDNPQGVFQFGAGEPIMTPKGDYIYQKDDVFEDPNVEGLLHLEKEPAVSFRHQFEFAFKQDLDQTLKGPEGLDVRTLDYRDFLCPLKVATVHEADINVHLFDMQFERLRAMYRGLPVADKYFAETIATFNAPLSGDKNPKPEKGELEEGSKVLKLVNCADGYFRTNPYEGDEGQDLGLESEIWMVVDIRAKKLIWADYLGNHMAKRPFEVIPGIELVQNRWYGVGVFAMLDHKQKYVDTQFNRVNFKSSKSSGVRFRVKNAVAQWKAGEKMVVGDDKIYDIEDPRFDSRNPPLFQVNLTEIDEYAMKLIELMIQAGSTEVGIVGPDDGAMAGLDTTKLATGIKSLERTGNLLMKFTEADHADGITAVLDQAVDFILENMDEDEVAYKADTDQLLALNRQEIRKSRKSVKLLLTKSRSTELIESARMVIQLVREYYEALTPYERYKLRPEYLRQLKALEVPDADNRLDEVTKEQADAWLKEQAEKKPDLPPKTSVASKITLYPSERAQIVAREGIVPASLEEMQAEDKRQADAEVDKQKKIAIAKEDAKPDPVKPAAAKK